MQGAYNKELFPLSSEQTRPIDFKRIALKYLRFWYLFVLGAFISLGIAFLYIRYRTTPTYYVSSTILIKDEKNESNISSAAAFSDIDLFKTAKNIDNEIEVIKSRSLMERVATELDLNVTYHMEGRVKDVEIYGQGSPIKLIINELDVSANGKEIIVHINSGSTFKLESDGKISSHNFGQQIKKPYGKFTIVATPNFSSLTNSPKTEVKVRFHDIRNVAAGFANSLSVYLVNKNSTVLGLGLVVEIPQKGKNILNKLIEVYNKEALEDRNLIAANTIDFIDERLNYLTTELSGVEKNVEEYKSLNEVTDVSTQANNYLEQANDYNKQLSEWATQIEVLESIENYLKANNNQYKMVPSTLGIQDPTLLGLIAKFNELGMERERMLLTIQPNNPLIQNINDQLGNLKVNILENLQNIKRGLKITSNNLKATTGQFKSRIKKVPIMERELLEINRQQAIKQNLYLYLLQKREESALSLAASVSNTRVIDGANGGDYPIAPNKSIIYLMSLLLGLAIPFGGIYIKELLNDKVETQEDVKLNTNTPILGEIAHNPTKETVVVTKTSRSPIVEMFRLIRANLHFASVTKENKVLLVTSSMGGEGKTFFTINLGASFAITGKKVVIIELDLRKPRLSKELGMDNKIGITNYLVSNKIELEELVIPSEKAPGVFVISAGPIPPNPSELLLSPKLAYLINQLKENFDHIILDTSPIGQVADAFSLSPLIDSSIYLIRYNYTSKKQIEIIDNIYKNKSFKHPMIVLNDAKKSNGNSYGYGYGYGYGEETKTPKKKKAVK